MILEVKELSLAGKSLFSKERLTRFAGAGKVDLGE
jgi:hypothetical protein